VPLLRLPGPDIPEPTPSAVSEPYWEACRRGELRHQRCADCGAIPHRPSRRCPRCLAAALCWEVGRGSGRLYSWTVVWRPQHPAFAVPYAPAIVTLDEGHHMISAVVGCDTADLVPGLRLRVEFHLVGRRTALPYFSPLEP
jgi:uncharacterized OB-fold protein